MTNEEQFQRLKELRPHIDASGDIFVIVDESDFSWLIEHVRILEKGIDLSGEESMRLYSDKKRYKQALEFYADKNNWQEIGVHDNYVAYVGDNGERARQELGVDE